MLTLHNMMTAVQPHVPFPLNPFPVNFLIGIIWMSHLTNKELDLNVGQGNWYTFLNAQCRMILYPTIIFCMYFRVIISFHLKTCSPSQCQWWFYEYARKCWTFPYKYRVVKDTEIFMAWLVVLRNIEHQVLQSKAFNM